MIENGFIATKHQRISVEENRKKRLNGNPIFIPASNFNKKGMNSFFSALCKSYDGAITPADKFNEKKMKGDVFIRGFQGMRTHNLIRDLISKKRNFYFVDSGYFGNETLPYKRWHRVTKNDFQNCKITSRKSDRARHLNLNPKPWRRNGDFIMICPPSMKSMGFFMGKKIEEKDVDSWITGVVNGLRKHTDRPIVVRKKNRSRKHRIFVDPLSSALEGCYALITYNSIAAVESVYHGVPAITLAPNAAQSMCVQSLSDINSLIYPDRSKWINHLSYCQFKESDAASGFARKILEE